MLNIDEQDHNADWLKMTWDLLDITNVEELKEYLKAKGKTVEEFKKLPAYYLALEDAPWLKEL